MSTLIDYIRKNNDKRGWNETSLSRHMDVSKSTVSSVMCGGKASADFCVRLADSYDEPVEYILRLAGHLKRNPPTITTKLHTELIYVASRLPEQKSTEVVGFARYKLEEK